MLLFLRRKCHPRGKMTSPLGYCMATYETCTIKIKYVTFSYSYRILHDCVITIYNMWINWNTSIQWLSFCGIVCISVHPEIYNELQYLIILDHKNMPPLTFKKLALPSN